MCGFIGFNNNNFFNDKELNEALKLIEHRGPDGNRILKDQDSKISMGFCRLSIQDVSEKAMQPFTDNSKKIFISFNGEIYNFKKLRKELQNLQVIFNTSSDTEVLLMGYKVWGIKKLLNKIKGMFAFVILDKNLDKLILARDPFGIKPLYYSNQTNFIFASEIKPISYLIKDFAWDEEGAISCLFSGMPQKGLTPYKNIKELKPGNLAFFDLKSKNIDFYEYFNPSNLVDENEYNKLNKMSFNEIIEYFNNILNHSVNEHMISDVKVGSCFSAGLDSSLISSLATKHEKSDDLKLFCYLSNQDKEVISECTKDFSNIFNNKIEYIKEQKEYDLLKQITDNLYYTEIPNKIEGSALSEVCKTANNQGYKVLLTGDAADEVFGGYHFHQQFYNRSVSSRSKLNFFLKALNFLQPLNLFELSNINPSSTDYFYQPSHLDLFELPYNLLVNKDNRLKTWKENQNSYQFIQNESIRDTQAFILDGLDYKLGKYLHRSDRYGMRNSVELRLPFLDLSFVKATLNLNLKYKMKISFFKRKIIDKIMLRHLSKQNGVPNKIINRKKIGTNFNYKEKLRTICENTKFDHCASILKTKEKDIKYNLVNSSGPNIEMFQYNFLSQEILGRLFIENINKEKIIEKYN